MRDPLEGLNVAAVPYLNAIPLVHRLRNVRTGVPSQLAVWLESGACDLATMPLGAVLGHPGWRVLPSLGIACDGPVRTVLLLHDAPLGSLRSFAPDPASRTSNLLAKWIVSHHSGEPVAWDPSNREARVVIGDAAFAHTAAEGTDLGLAWRSATGLPFVFAAWVVSERLASDKIRLRELDGFLRGNLAATDTELADISRLQTAVSADVARKYLVENILYPLDDRFRSGADRFAGELAPLGHGAGGIPWAF